MTRQYVIKKGSPILIVETDHSMTNMKILGDMIFDESLLNEVVRPDIGGRDLLYEFSHENSNISHILVGNEYVVIKSVQNTPKNTTSESQQNQGVKSSDLGCTRSIIL